MTVGRGDAFRHARNWREAVTAYKQALYLDCNDARAHAGLAMTLLGLRRLLGASTEADLAVACAPEYAFAHVAVAAVRLAERRVDEAWMHCEIALANGPRDVDARLLGASIRTQQGDLGSARQLLDEALRLERTARVLSALAHHGVRTGELDDAERWADEAVADDPASGEAHLAAATVALARGKLYDAERHGRAAVDLEPSVEALKVWARIRRGQGAVMGLVWTVAVWTYAYTFGRRLTGAIGTYIAAQIAIVLAHAAGLDRVADYLLFAWLGWCVYTWVAPNLALGWIQKQLRFVPREGN